MGRRNGSYAILAYWNDPFCYWISGEFYYGNITKFVAKLRRICQENNFDDEKNVRYSLLCINFFIYGTY